MTRALFSILLLTTISGCGGTQSMHHEFSVQAQNGATDIIYPENPTEEQISSLVKLAHVAHLAC